MKDRLLVAWSGAKDSARALYELKYRNGVEIAALLTTAHESSGTGLHQTTMPSGEFPLARGNQ